MFPLNVIAAGGRSFDLLAEFGPSTSGFRRAFNEGSITPDLPYVAGQLIENFHTSNAVPSNLNFDIQSINIPNDDSSFRLLQISGIFSHGQQTEVFLRVDATYTPSSAGNTRWTWLFPAGIFLDFRVYNCVLS